MKPKLGIDYSNAVGIMQNIVVFRLNDTSMGKNVTACFLIIYKHGCCQDFSAPQRLILLDHLRILSVLLHRRDCF